MNKYDTRNPETQIYIFETTCPDERQTDDIMQLVRLCQLHDGISISCPLDPDDPARHFLLYGTSDHTCPLLSVLSVLQYDTESAECTAFTHPDWRRQGFFSELLDRVLETIGDCDILFPVSGHCPDTIAVLDAIGAEPESEELQMELELTELNPEELNPARRNMTQTELLSDLLRYDTDLETGITEWTLFKASDCTRVLGSCQTSFTSDDCVCLHHVEILSEFRGQGYGTRLMQQLLDALQNSRIHRVILQVSGDNTAAITLYKNQGFRITETLSFYLY